MTTTSPSLRREVNDLVLDRDSGLELGYVIKLPIKPLPVSTLRPPLITALMD